MDNLPSKKTSLVHAGSNLEYQTFSTQIIINWMQIAIKNNTGNFFFDNFDEFLFFYSFSFVVSVLISFATCLSRFNFFFVYLLFFKTRVYILGKYNPRISQTAISILKPDWFAQETSKQSRKSKFWLVDAEIVREAGSNILVCLAFYATYEIPANAAVENS